CHAIRRVQRKTNCKRLSRRKEQFREGTLDPVQTFYESGAATIMEHAGCYDRAERSGEAQKKVRRFDALFQFQLYRDSDRIPREIAYGRLAVFIEQLYRRESRCPGEHAGWIDRARVDAWLEVASEDIARRTVHTHAPVFNPDGSRT